MFDFEAWLCCLDTESLANHVASVSLGLLICKMGIQAVSKGQTPPLDVKVSGSLLTQVMSPAAPPGQR